MIIIFVLPEALNIYQIEELQQELINFLENKSRQKKQEIILDAKETEDIDAAGLQMLLSFKNTAQNRGLQCKIINQKDLFSKLLLLAGGRDVCDH